MNNVEWTPPEIQKLKQAWNKSKAVRFTDFSIDYSRHTDRTPNAIRGKLNYLRNSGEIKAREVFSEPAKILYVDIETLPMWVKTFTLRTDYISPKCIIKGKDECLLGWAAAWEHEDEIDSDILTPKEAKARNAKRILIGLYKKLAQADVVVVQNGIKFDLPKLTGFFKINGFDPLPPFKVIDVYKESKRFGLVSRSQYYLSRRFGTSQKIENSGFELWDRCDEGDSDALIEMQFYNVGDVQGMKENYREIAPFIPNHPNLGIYDGVKDKCPVCGGELRQSKRIPTNKSMRNSCRCNSCGWVGVK